MAPLGCLVFFLCGLSTYTSAQDFDVTEAGRRDRVRSLPGVLPEDLGVQYAGRLPVSGDPKAGQLFYWFVARKGFENKHQYQRQPTLLWSNGGPGASSFWGFFTENGPYVVKKVNKSDIKLEPRRHAWSNFANYLIIEQPMGVTYSYSQTGKDYPTNPYEGTTQLHFALQELVKRLPFLGQNAFVLTGESYAGTYHSLLAREIVESNRKHQWLKLPLAVLGDPWVSPKIQMGSIFEFAWRRGFINLSQKQKLEAEYPVDDLSRLALRKGALAEVLSVSKDDPFYLTNVAGRQPRGDVSTDLITKYLSSSSVLHSLHIDPATLELPLKLFSARISEYYNDNVNDDMVKHVQYLLDHSNTKILVLSGLNDGLDCNFVGVEAWMSKLVGVTRRDPAPWVANNWNRYGSIVLEDLDKPCDVGQSSSHEDDNGDTGCGSHGREILGFLESGDRISWVKVLNAGHMAPGDSPKIIQLIMDQLGSTAQ